MGNQVSGAELTGGAPIENPISLQWTTAVSTNPPSPREGHSAAVHHTTGKIYVFGGGSSTPTGPAQSNELFSFDPATQIWTKIEASSAPSARTGATAAFIGDKFFLFGGLNSESGWVNDLHVFDVAHNTWSSPSTSSNGPSARDKLNCVVVGNKIYYFGGFGPQVAQEAEEDEEDEQQEAATFGWFNDLHVLNTEDYTWTTLSTTGAVPSPRAAFGMSLIDQDKIYIIGGRDNSKRVNDVFFLDLHSLVWTRVENIAGSFPSARSFHSCNVVTGTRKIVLFGGLNRSNIHLNDVHIYDVDANAWLQPKVEGSIPAPRGFHVSLVVGRQLVVFGGSSQFDETVNECKQYHNETYFIDTTPIIEAPPTVVPAEVVATPATAVPVEP